MPDDLWLAAKIKAATRIGWACLKSDPGAAQGRGVKAEDSA